MSERHERESSTLDLLGTVLIVVFAGFVYILLMLLQHQEKELESVDPTPANYGCNDTIVKNEELRTLVKLNEYLKAHAEKKHLPLYAYFPTIVCKET